MSKWIFRTGFYENFVFVRKYGIGTIRMRYSVNGHFSTADPVRIDRKNRIFVPERNLYAVFSANRCRHILYTN